MKQFSVFTTHVSTLLLSDLLLFCSFILSHPLYFSYFIFFSPYLLKLISFLSPLFITTFLLLLAFLTVSPTILNDVPSRPHSESKPGFLLSTYHTVLYTLRSSLDESTEKFHMLEELESCIAVLEKSIFEAEGNPNVEFSEVECQLYKFPETSLDIHVVDSPTYQHFPDPPKEKTVNGLSENSHDIHVVDSPTYQCFSDAPKQAAIRVEENKSTREDIHAVDSPTYQSFFDAPTEAAISVEENKTTTDDINVVGSPTYYFDVPKGAAIRVEENKSTIDSPKGLSYSEQKFVLPDSISQSKVKENCASYARSQSENIERRRYFPFWPVIGKEELEAKSKVSSIHVGEVTPIVQGSPKVLGSCGSTRKEKEWKRTLACKLYEERQNVGVDGGEGMDSLWESYEAETGSKKTTTKPNNKEKVKKEKKMEIEYYEEDDGEDEDDEEDMNVQLCCLQALKFSTKKMNLGLGRPNLLKISKALKGIGWFHHSSKHGKRDLN